jgi:pimeloyl-ACP methyl ester carboxylesterase
MFADVLGHRAWFQPLGDTGPPILLVMGFGMSGVVWRPIAAHLARDHRVVLYDCRGIGQSSPGEGPHGVPFLADDAAALMETLGWSSAHVVGVSMGGMVAQELALRHGGMCRSLTLIATHGGPFRSVFPTPRGLRLFLTANTLKGEARLSALGELLFPGIEEAQSVMERLNDAVVQRIEQPTAAAIRLAHLRSILKHHTLPRLHALRDLPVLVVKPALDILVPSHGSDMLHAVIPASKLVTFPQGGHGLITQYPETLSQLLAEHVGRAKA